MSDIRYKIRARSKWDWRSFDTVRMEISVGQPYHEGEKFAVAMDWARENFKNIVLIVADTSQRFNVMYHSGCTEQKATEISLQSGADWINRNKQHLYGSQITRWDDWKKGDYILNRAAVSRLYAEDSVFHETITQAMAEFSTRHKIGESDMKRYLNLTEQYFLEETAVFATAFDKIGGISAYPGTFLETWEACILSNNPLIPKGLKKAQWARLTFEKRLTPADSIRA